MGRKKQTEKKFNPSPGLVRLSYRLLLEDKAMVAVLFIGGLASTLVFAAITIPAWTFANIVPIPTSGNWFGFLIYGVAVWASSFVSILTLGVVVAAAQIRCEGGAPDIRRALAVAWSRRAPLAAWAALSTIVALLMLLLERLGIAGVIVRLLTGLAWAVATIFAVPILISEGTGPFETAKRSAHIVKNELGTVIRSNVRLALPWVVVMIGSGVVAGVGAVAFVIAASDGATAVAVIAAVPMILGGITFVFCAITSSALSAFLDTLLYRYANGLPVPEIESRDLPPVTA